MSKFNLYFNLILICGAAIFLISIFSFLHSAVVVSNLNTIRRQDAELVKLRRNNQMLFDQNTILIEVCFGKSPLQPKKSPVFIPQKN